MTLTFAELRKQLDDAEKELAAASELEQKRRVDSCGSPKRFCRKGKIRHAILTDVVP
jgi:hypothetical protein